MSEQGKIDLDKSLYSYFGKKVVKNDVRSEQITARMVLSHSTGLPNLDKQKPEMKFYFDPGSDFKYSGHAYLYLQKVIEKITGKSLNELADDIVFEPLKMTQSSFKWQKDYRAHIASSYNSDRHKYPSKESPLLGRSAWSLFTTLKDYSIFVSHIIDTSKSSDSVASQQLESNVDVANKVKWGLGWGLQDTEPNQSFWHWGSNPGFKHYVVGYPNEKLAVIVLSNSDNAFKIVDDVMIKAIGGSYPSYDWF